MAIVILADRLSRGWHPALTSVDDAAGASATAASATNVSVNQPRMAVLPQAWSVVSQQLKSRTLSSKQLLVSIGQRFL
jgi:hypothetical protein